MHCHVHTGMHKTGTSSIQATLEALPPLRVRYFPWPGNQSPRLLTLFEAQPYAVRDHELNGRSKAVVDGLGKRWLRHLRETLAGWQASGAVTDVVFSGEELSNPATFRGDAFRRLADEMRRHFHGLTLYGYLRPPGSFMESDFQQVLKMGGPAMLDLSPHYPRYRDRFERMDRAVGRENVVLRRFDRRSMVKGDVVSDFAAQIGLPLAPGQIVRANESLGLEATSLLFAIRRSGRGIGGAVLSETTLSVWLGEVLTPLSERRFAVAPALVDDIVLANYDDMAWAEARLGTALDEAPGGAAVVVRSERDLLEIAADAKARILDLGVFEVPPDAPFAARYPDLTRRDVLAWVEEGLMRDAA